MEAGYESSILKTCEFKTWTGPHPILGPPGGDRSLRADRLFEVPNETCCGDLVDHALLSCVGHTFRDLRS